MRTLGDTLVHNFPSVVDPKGVAVCLKRGYCREIPSYSCQICAKLVGSFWWLITSLTLNVLSTHAIYMM